MPNVADAIERVAVRFVRAWGFTTVGMVARCFRLTTAANAPRATLTRQALVGFHDLRWLEPTCEWFTLVERESRVKACVAKVVGVAGSLDDDDLFRALGKGHSFGDAPSDVVHAYLREVVTSVAAHAPLVGARLTREERILVDVLRDMGGAADVEQLRRVSTGRSMTPVAVRRTLCQSPLFVRVGRGAYRLVGVPRAVGTLVASGPWEATL